MRGWNLHHWDRWGRNYQSMTTRACWTMRIVISYNWRIHRFTTLNRMGTTVTTGYITWYFIGTEMWSIMMHIVVSVDTHISNSSIWKRWSVSPSFGGMLTCMKCSLNELVFFETRRRRFKGTIQVDFIFVFTRSNVQRIMSSFAFAFVFPVDNISYHTSQHYECKENTKSNVKIAVRNLFFTYSRNVA